MEPRSQKPLAFVGRSLRDLRDFPDKARQQAGFQLHRLQEGKNPLDFRPMPTVGRGVYEIRVRSEGRAHRVFYVAKFEEAIYVLHAFEKRTRKTSPQDIAMGQRRYRTVLENREGKA